MRLETVYDAVFPLISQKLQSASNLGAVIEKRSKRQTNPRAVLDREIARISREMETINQRVAGLYESYVDKLLSEMEYVGMKASYENRAEALRQAIDGLSQRAAMVEDVSVSENRWLKAAMDFQNPVALTKEMLEAIVERIEISGTHGIEIVWKFADEFALLLSCAEQGPDTQAGACGLGKEGA